MSIATIGASLLARLRTLLTTADPPGYVESAQWVAGDRESQAKIEAAAMVTNNVVVIARDRMRREADRSVVTLAGASSRTVITTRWRVRVLVRDALTPEHALTTANTGMHALVDAVLGALDGFEAAGLAPNTRVHFVEDDPDRHKPGRYISTLLFETTHWHDAPDSDETGEEPLVLNADVNLEGQPDAAPNPVAQLTTE